MKVVFPSRKDPRLYMTTSLCLFVTLSQVYLGFSQTREQIVTGILACCFFDVLLTAVSVRALTIPLSGLISGLSLGLLLDSGTRVLPFVLAAILAIGSKYVVKYKGKHFFNPTNFALVIILFTNLGSITPGYQWGGGTTALWIALSMGGLLLYRVKRLALLGSFIVFFLISAITRAELGQETLPLAFGVLTGAPFQLFTFFMLTDPRTTPNSTRGQVLFSAAVVLTDVVLRWIWALNTLFISLFVVDAFILLAALLGFSFDVHFWKTSTVSVDELKVVTAVSEGVTEQSIRTGT
jgi:Na+-translocating ferredoxin:NAD+ oxidoreductase RnfD subunit